MVIFNPIHLNMHRQGPVGTGESFITPELAFAECAGKCMWARALTAAQICLGDTGERWWERDVIGKAIEHLSLASDSVKLWSPTVSSYSRSLWSDGSEHSHCQVISYLPLFFILLSFSIGKFGLQSHLVAVQINERSVLTPANPPLCFHIHLRRSKRLRI